MLEPQSADKKIIPDPVLKRLPRYLTHVRELRRQGVVWISSQKLAEALGLTSSTVRQDLSHLDLDGVSKRGYETARMEEVVRRELGGDITQRMIIVGAGYLGSALALHGDLARHGFHVCALFDSNLGIHGTQVGDLSVRPMDALDTVVRELKADIGLIAVPTGSAQDVADKLVAAGIKGILNLAYVHLRVPRHVHVVDARIIASLQELAHTIRSRNGAASSSAAKARAGTPATVPAGV